MRLKTEDERIAAVRSHLNEGDYDIRGLVVMLHPKLTRSDIRHCLFYLRKHEGIISYLDGDGEETYGTK